MARQTCNISNKTHGNYMCMGTSNWDPAIRSMLSHDYEKLVKDVIQSYTISSLPRKKMVLSSYMLSPAICGYLKKRGQHRVGLIWQVTRLVRTIMLLLVLIETLKRRELYGSVQKIRSHWYNIAKEGQTKVRIDLKMGYNAASSSFKQ
eukprot:2733261-Ditylum_brightwellii.AAC.1